jgi:formylglycine-generating enzyme required for sulfatase activity
MSPRVPRLLALWVQLGAFACAVTGLGLPAPPSRARADDASDDRGGKRAAVAFEKTTTVDLGGGVTMEFVLILPGKFLMGSPPDENGRNPLETDFDAEKQHVVTITRPFYLAKYPMTQEQYEAITGKNPSYYSAGGSRKADVTGLDTRRFPAEGVSWDDAQACCARMTTNGRHRHAFRLPTEAEWEYACRAGTTTPFHFGSALNGKQANCNGGYPYGTDRKGPYLDRPTTVGSYPANPWGLHDMNGNVGEWCQDYYGPYEGLAANDPVRDVPDSPALRVVRGGSWISSANQCRAANRDSYRPSKSPCFVGFRVAFRPE